jgi:hypothetical protein
MDSSDKDNQRKKVNCCGRFTAEWRLGMFSLEDTEGKTLDLEKTFKPTPKVAFSCFKLFLLIWIVSINCITIVRAEPPSFWPALLTNWTATIVTLYFLASFTAMTILPIQQKEGATIWIRMTWVLYSLSLNLSLVVTILFWSLVGGEIEYTTVMQHGGFLLFVLVDGMLINRIPIRFKQIIWVEVIGISYFLWTIIHASTSIGNPFNNSGNPDIDDDALYGVINWKKNAEIAGIVFVGMIVVGVPVLYLLLWLLSLLFKPQHYITDDDQARREDKVEQGQEEDFVQNPKE